MVWKSVVFAALLTLSLLPAPAQAAGEDCRRVDLATFEEVRIVGPLEGFAGWQKAVGYTLERLPMLPTALALRGDVACDLTHGLGAFLGERAAPVRASDAIDLARLAVGSVYVDVLPEPKALDGARVTPLARGYVVDLPVWTARNGVVADARVVLDGTIEATFAVREMRVGAYEPAIEGWLLLPGDTDAKVNGLQALTTKVILGTNADGSQWRVTYFTQNYANESEADRHAQMHLEGGLRAYANETAWGLVSQDPDRILDLTLDGCDCIYSGYNTNIHMFPRAFDILPLLPGLDYRTEAEAAELILGHELFHHFQYSHMQWRAGSWFIEGMARFSETVAMPDATFLPSTLTYYTNDNGMNGFLANPARGIGGHSYDWSIVWGWLYAHEGGIDLIVEVLDLAADGSASNSETGGPAVIQAAMDAVPGGEHATFEESYLAFAEAIFTHEGWEWGDADGAHVHDWSEHFQPVTRVTTAASQSANLPQWAIRAHQAKPTVAGGASAIYYDSAAPIVAAAFVDGDFRALEEPATALVGHTDAALVVVRTAPGFAGSYTYAIVR